MGVSSDKTPPGLYNEAVPSFERVQELLIVLQNYDYWLDSYGEISVIHNYFSLFMDEHIYDKETHNLPDSYLVSQSIFGQRLKWISDRRNFVKEQVTYRNWIKNKTEVMRNCIGEFFENTILGLVNCGINIYERYQNRGNHEI